MTLRFSQVDVFGREPLAGNPLAVVHGADTLSTAAMQSFARWTNLSETAFLLAPTTAAADYRVRIFTTIEELPFAGHPTLGSAHAWLGAGGVPRTPGTVVQECGAGLVDIRLDGAELAFAAPPLVRSGAVGPEDLAHAAGSLGVRPDRVVDAAWIDNGPGWLGLLLATADDVLALTPDFAAMAPLDVAVIGPHQDGPADYEVRSFYDTVEDPVTGSSNAGFALWLTRAGLAPSSYTVRQGTVLGRDGRVSVTTTGDRVWIGGTARTVVTGEVDLPVS